MSDKLSCVECGSKNLKVNYHNNNQQLVDPNTIESVECLNCRHRESYFTLTKRGLFILNILTPLKEESPVITKKSEDI